METFQVKQRLISTFSKIFLDCLDDVSLVPQLQKIYNK